MCIRDSLITARQIDRLLAEASSQIFRKYHFIRNDVRNISTAERTRIPQEAHLYRRGPQRKNFLPTVSGIAMQVYQNMDAIGSDALGSLAIR